MSTYNNNYGVYGQSNGTIPGQRLTNAEHTFIILSFIGDDVS